MVRCRITSTVSPPFHLSLLIHLIGNRRTSGLSLNFRFSINESSESGETVEEWRSGILSACKRSARWWLRGPPFHLSHLTHLIENRRASESPLNLRFSINESSESGETVAHGVTFFSSKIGVVPNRRVFSCLFMRLSCLGCWPRPEDAPQSEARRVDCRRQRRSRPQGSA